MAWTNVLVLVHGMTTTSTPCTHEAEYDQLKQGLFDKEPDLGAAFGTNIIQVEWGHRPEGMAPPGDRRDQRITAAEFTIHERTAYANVAGDKSPQNHVLGPLDEIFSKLVTRRVTDTIKEAVLLYGATDVFYYCAPDGEDAVRTAVYSEVLAQLGRLKPEPAVKIHLIGHSLGVTVGYDFLFGLFAPDSAFSTGHPGFLDSTASQEMKDEYSYWRRRVGDGALTLGSITSTAGQLPLTMMRKQFLVDILANGGYLDPTVIGITPDGPAQWRMFYDVDDILGFPGRRLFTPCTAIEEYQVDTDWRPDLSHSEYWGDDTVLTRSAELMFNNL